MGLEHAMLTNLDTGQQYEVLFNPSEYALEKDNTFAQAAVPGLGSPLLQFVHGGLRSLEMELFFDSYEAHRAGGRHINDARSDVRDLTGPVVALMAINPETHAPPVVLFAWGQLTFTGVVAKVTQRFTMFLESGVPVRATLQVTFSEFVDAEEEAKQVKRSTADFTRVHVVAEGEVLSAIAFGAYGDSRKWRPIALANGLEDARRPAAGRALDVPALPYRDPATGRVYG